MVEMATSPYDDDDIPFVHASIVSIDDELSPVIDRSATVHAVPSNVPINISMVSPVHEHEAVQSSASDTSEGLQSERIGMMQQQNQEQQQSDIRDEAQRDLQRQLSEKDIEKEKQLGAGAAGAVFGMLLGGPFLAVAFGVGTLYYSKQEGPSGDVARALGEVALVARDKAKELNTKHHLVDKGKTVASKAIEKLQEADRKHHMKEHFYAFVVWSWKATLDLAEKHHLKEKATRNIQLLFERLREHVLEHQRKASLRGERERQTSMRQ